MKIETLDHVNVRTSNLQEMIAWYGTVMDMHPGDRPPFNMGGAWIYASGKPVLHLVEVADEPKSVEPKIEHYALGASGMAEFLDRLKVNDVPYSIDTVPEFPIVQVNFRDPDGNHIHVDFSAEEGAPFV